MRREASRSNYITIGVRIILGVVFFYTLWSLTKNLIEFTQLDERLIAAQKEVSILEQEKARLQAEVEEVNTPFYEENSIRNQLGLVKPGETVVIIPDDSLEYSNQPELSHETTIVSAKPIWQQWLMLFL